MSGCKLKRTFTYSKPAEATKLIKQLEEKMYALARELEFEEAAKIRDEIKKIQTMAFVD